MQHLYLKRGLVVFFLVLAGLLVIGYLYKVEQLTDGKKLEIPLTEDQIIDNLSQLSLQFEENKGQVDEQVKFLVKHNNTTIFFTPQEIVYEIFESKPTRRRRDVIDDTDLDEPEEPRSGVVIRQSFSGSEEPQVVGLNQLEGQVNYFKGSNPDEWVKEASTYGRIEYQQIYPGINLQYFGSNSQLSYRFIIEPGADPGQIKVELAGIDKLTIADDGALVMQTSLDNFGASKPSAYQEVDGEQRPINVEYSIISESSYRFNLAGYDPGLTLYIYN